MAQLMPLPLTVSCFSKIQIGFTFLVPAHLGSPGQRAVKRARVCVCACACACVCVRTYYCCHSRHCYAVAVAFRMYDVNGDGFITQDELLSLLSMMVGSNITPEQVTDILLSLLC